MSILAKMQKQFPAGVLALFALIGTTLIVFAIGGFFEGASVRDTTFGKMATAGDYILWDVLIAISSYLIVKGNPKSIWYVPLICNALTIVSVAVEPASWTSYPGLIFCAGWVMSIAGGLLGRRSGLACHHHGAERRYLLQG